MKNPIVPTMRIFLCIITLTLFSGICKAAEAEATETPFSTSYNITYNIGKDGGTDVSETITISNKQNDVIATDYAVTLNQLNIFGVKVTDNKKSTMEFIQEKKGTATTITTKLRNQIIGEGRQNVINLKYGTLDIASKVGDIWNVTTPPTSNLENINEYNVTLVIPKFFGSEIFVSPKPNEKIDGKDSITYKFDKNGLSNNGISAAFGKYQTLNFNLKFHLKNSSMFNSNQKIALPPEIKDRQSVEYQNLDPKPTSMELDKDGNYIATYKVPGKGELNVTLIGSAKLLGKQIQPEFGATMSELPNDLVNAYTKKQKYWEVDDADIKQLAKDLLKPENTVSQNAKAVYDYITKNQNYDFDVTKKDYIERKGAAAALKDKSAWACMEFTDLFITVTRAMGIPARELNGYAFSKADSIVPLSIDLRGGDLLHAWPEYFDPKFGWVPVDPTWGTTSGIDYFTKLDTNHFVFSIKGLSSEFPLPAGAYRFDTDEKQIQVDFAQNADTLNFGYQVRVTNVGTWNFIKILMGYKAIDVENLGGTVIHNLMDQGTDLLPYQKTTIYVKKSDTEIFYYDFNGAKLNTTI